MDSGQVPAGSIVVGIDGSASSEDALTWAIEQAGLERRPLTVVHSVEPVGFPGAGGMYASPGIDYSLMVDESRQAAQVLMVRATTAAKIRYPDLAVHRVLNNSDPRSTLLDLGEAAAMVVVGTRGLGPVSSLLLGSVSVSVSKHATCPVVVHRSTPAHPSRHGVLVGVDGTGRSLPAIEFAYRMASWRGLSLTVLHCYSDAAPGALRTGEDLPATSSEQALVAESLAGMQEKFPEVEVQVRLTRGFADQQLVEASHNYDLLVIGHQPVSALNDLLHGCVAPVVLEHARSAVAVVPVPVSTLCADPE